MYYAKFKKVNELLTCHKVRLGQSTIRTIYDNADRIKNV